MEHEKCSFIFVYLVKGQSRGARTRACRIETRLDAAFSLRNPSSAATIQEMGLHRRRLPHIYPKDTSLFLTWHLHGSLPASLPPPPGPLTSGGAFVWLDANSIPQNTDRCTCGGPKLPA